MAAPQYPSNDFRRQLASPPRPRPTRDNKDTLCRNVVIYGHCRYEDRGCNFNHPDQNNKMSSNQPQADLPSKKQWNVDSPAFTPASAQPSAKKPTFSSQAAAVAPFKPRGAAAVTPVVQTSPESPAASTVSATAKPFNPSAIREFTPQNAYDPTNNAGLNGASSEASLNYEPFSMPPPGQGFNHGISPGVGAGVGPGAGPNPYNPYMEDSNALPVTGTTFYGTQGAAYAQITPVHPKYHLYWPLPPRREDLLPYQRLTRDFFMDDKLREQIQRMLSDAQQVIPNSQLPSPDNYHTLVPLDTNHRKNPSTFGYPSWVYKALSNKNGQLYCLRRLEKYQLSNENAIRTVRDWRRVNNANVVTVFSAFTTRVFGDSSLVFVTDYHSSAKTLFEVHFPHLANSHLGNTAPPKTTVTEGVLWSYIVQIANALKAIHSAKLAARCLELSKIIVTGPGKARLRLGACAILDVVQYELRRPLQDLQQEDFVQFAKVIIAVATNTPSPLPGNPANIKFALDQIGRTYSIELRETVAWLINTEPAEPKTIDNFIRGISHRVMDSFNDGLHGVDGAFSELYKEVENGRLFRLMCKLNAINERFSHEGNNAWSETGERYLLKLFRDYVFHQVDAQGTPVLDMGHMLRALTKLDVGTDEQLCLTSRDNQTAFLVTYKELKKQLNSAFSELSRKDKQGARAF